MGQSERDPDWDQRFMAVACLVATWSADRSVGVGCVFVRDHAVLVTGFNSFPRGVRDLDERFERPEKYLWTEHAERNAIYSAARQGISLASTTAYLNWFPCIDCARALIQVGVRRLVARQPDVADSRWGTQFQAALDMLAEVGVEVCWVDGPNGDQR